MASGNARAYRGSFTGTGADLDITVIGFRPTSVRLINVDDDDQAEWNNQMQDGAMYKRLAAGTGAMQASNGITPLSNGFRIGADPDMNVVGEKVNFEAWD